ncbi:unnamed protein product [Bursaphelenchus okinawaensis]|uniref:DNA mismatch repair proteins mutS family domain-containing protein n=1 Tax=Bursaphelenchus okinawaensis TaxID=465554 RepID=A0A811JUC8_9BILA|nr:unnamed protein product [Bursaphelenchus okinawaensis]CAG9082963.1 unnamed protein product [Bursaphelenchus okinawaensis]
MLFQGLLHRAENFGNKLETKKVENAQPSSDLKSIFVASDNICKRRQLRPDHEWKESENTTDAKNNVSATLLTTDSGFNAEDVRNIVQKTWERADVEAERAFINQYILDKTHFNSDANAISFNGSSNQGSTGRLTNRSINRQYELYAKHVTESLTADCKNNIKEAVVQAVEEMNDEEITQIWRKVLPVLTVEPSDIEETEAYRSSDKWINHIFLRSTAYLQTLYKEYMEMVVENNMEQARRGGRPGVLSLVEAFLNVVCPDCDFQDGLSGKHPIWAIVYNLLRIGEFAVAAKVVKTLVSVPNCSVIVNCISNLSDSGLDANKRMKLNAEWKHEGGNCTDPFKRACYGIFLGVDCPEVTDSIENWLWVKLMQCKLDGQHGRSQFRKLQNTVCVDCGEDYFVKNGGNFSLYFTALWLTGQIERSIEVLYRSGMIHHAVHIAILANQKRLLMIGKKISEFILTQDENDSVFCKLNFARLVLLYVKNFELDNVEYALSYCFFLKDLYFEQEVNGGRTILEGCISRLCFISHQTDLILGHLTESGDVKRGFIFRFEPVVNTNDIIDRVAKDSDISGETLTACRLFLMIKRGNDAFQLCSKHLVSLIAHDSFEDVSNRKESEETIKLAYWLLNISEKNQELSFDVNLKKELEMLVKLNMFCNTAVDEPDKALRFIKELKLLPFANDELSIRAADYALIPEQVKPVMHNVVIALFKVLVRLSRLDSGYSRAELKQMSKTVLLFVAEVNCWFPMSRTPKGKKPIPVGPDQPSLFSYFKVTPKQTAESDKKENFLQTSSLKRTRSDSIEVEPQTPKSVKRRRVIISDDEDEDFVIVAAEKEASPPMTPTSAARKAILKAQGPITIKRIQKPATFTPGKSAKTPVKVKEIRGNASDKENDVDFVHLTFPFLKPENIRDAEKRRPDDPDYDPTTLYVPEQFIKDQSPGHRQWWKLKSANFDTVLFFKVGKFYELYHMDAVIAAEKLGISYMRGKFAHSGFPEIGYAKFAEGLIVQGYKVARVEQTETPDQLAERTKIEKVKDKVVRRELCRITSASTRGCTVMDTESLETVATEPIYLMAVKESSVCMEEGGMKPRYGICLIDCQIGQFFLSEFTDDESLTSFRTFLAHNQPKEYLFERGHITSNTSAVLASVLGKTNGIGLSSKKQFQTSDDTLKQLMNSEYLGNNVKDWPEALKAALNDVEEAIPTANFDYQLCISALGATLWQLKRCLVDVDMVTMKKFAFVNPSTLEFKRNTTMSREKWKGIKMVLDSYALNSLHLLPPNDPLSQKKTHEKKDAAGKDFSLYHTINRCITPFGKRELRRWICVPTCDPDTIQDRQQAVSYLSSSEGLQLVNKATEFFKKIVDLEKLFQSIHSMGLKYRSTEHPDSRAQMFESKKYGCRKVKNLALALDGMEMIAKLNNYYHQNRNNLGDVPSLVEECLCDKPEALLADLKHFNTLIGNRAKALEEGKIIPKPGIDTDYDNSLKGIEDAKQNLDEFLKEQKKKLKCTQLKFQGASKTPYHLEVPEELSKTLDFSYELKSRKQGWRRFTTPELDELVMNLDSALKVTQEFNNDYTRRVFESFDQKKERWVSLLKKMSRFDCLLSLALYASQSPIQMCLPEFDFEAEKPVIEITEGYHPTLATGQFQLGRNASEFIPNDTTLGWEKPALLLLTGANMGGKSTLMRQVAVLSVLAQLGSMVPAKQMKISPVDRIFCRIGASDCLAAGQSTFYMELNETNIILRSASPHSLAIVDELGRGTSTHDGTAIAGAVLRYMADKVGCRGVFSTHYHSLCRIAADNPRIAEGHMACLVEKDENSDDPCMENITFLYQLVEGSSSKSYGFFTAKMSGLKPDLIRKADRASKMIFNQEITLAKLKSLKLDVERGISDEDLIDKVGVVY